MKLWIDDCRPAPQGWIHASSVEEAIYIMSYKKDGRYPYRENFEEVSIDHDMGPTPADDGIHFIDWMVISGVWPKKTPQVHSMNPAGRARMKAAIERYYPGPNLP